MTLLPSLSQFVILIFAGLLVWAAWSDFTRYLIPNKLSIALALLYPAHAMLTPGAEPLFAIGCAALVFAVATGLFAVGQMGGGDVKLMSAVALWAGPSLVLPFILVMGLFGGVFAIVMASPVGALLPSPPVALFKDGVRPGKARRSLPYGVAIAASGLVLAAELLKR